jgi:hypothetical protein
VPSTDRKLELKAKTSVAQTGSQPAVYAKGLNVPCGLNIPSSFSDDSAIKRMTEQNFPRRMPHTKKKKSEPTSWWGVCSKHNETERERERDHIIVRTRERETLQYC